MSVLNMYTSSLNALNLLRYQPKEETPEIKMNGVQTKPLKVTFEDEVVKKNEVVERNETLEPISEQLSDADSESESSTASEADQSEEDEKASILPVDDTLVLTPDMADLMLSYLDMMNIRMVHCECTTAHLLKNDIAGAQARLNEAKRMLDDIPASMSNAERKVYMLEISQYVESIFGSLEKLAIKLVKCHGDTMCEIIQEFDENVKKIETEVKELEGAARGVDEKREKALRTIEVGVLSAFLVLTIFVVFLLSQPEIGGPLTGLILKIMNGTWNGTNNWKHILETNASGLDVLEDLEK